MEIKINIDESKFQEILEKELGAFTQEELHAIMKEAFKEYIKREDILKELITKKETDRWGGYVQNSSVMDKFVSTVNLNDIFEEPKEKIKEIICEEETLKSMALEILANLFKERFKSAFTQDWTFMDDLANRVAGMLMQKQQV